MVSHSPTASRIKLAASVLAALSLASITPAQADSPSGALLICGGGGLPKSVYQRFLDLAGGSHAKLVVIPTASSKEPSVSSIAKTWQRKGFDSVEVLHTRDRSIADTPEFVKPLHDADAVWISGGFQSRLAASYAGGAVEQALKELVSRGGVVGGSSAGAAIQSEVMIVGGNPNPKIGRGLGLLPDVIIDQHFLRRNRFNRLLKALQRKPDEIGIGIDEGTAIEVHGDTAEVLGKSAVVVVRPPQADHPLSISTYTSGGSFKLRPK